MWTTAFGSLAAAASSSSTILPILQFPAFPPDNGQDRGKVIWSLGPLFDETEFEKPLPRMRFFSSLWFFSYSCVLCYYWQGLLERTSQKLYEEPLLLQGSKG